MVSLKSAAAFPQEFEAKVNLISIDYHEKSLNRHFQGKLNFSLAKRLKILFLQAQIYEHWIEKRSYAY